MQTKGWRNRRTSSGPAEINQNRSKAISPRERAATGAPANRLADVYIHLGVACRICRLPIVRAFRGLWRGTREFMRFWNIPALGPACSTERTPTKPKRIDLLPD